MSFILLATSLAVPSSVQAIPVQTVAETEASRQAQLWLALVDRQAWADSWQASGDMLRARLSVDQWTQMMLTVRLPLGGVANRQLISVMNTIAPPNAPPGQYQIVQFKTDFAQKPGGVETVALVQQGADWRVVGYFIR